MGLIGLVLLAVIGIYYARGFIPGDKLPATILLMAVGTVVGLSLGAMLAALLPQREKAAVGASIALPLILAAATGMMSRDLRLIVMEKLPWLNRINPVALVHDGLYYLNYYPTKALFYRTLLELCLCAVGLLILIFVLTRRAEYENL